MKTTFTLLRCLVALTILLFAQYSFGQKVCLVGSAADMSGLSADEQDAYQWAMDTYGADAAYISFNDISMNGLPASCEVVWYHLQAATIFQWMLQPQPVL